MSERLHVLLMVETSMAFGRRVLEGISRYLVQNPHWSVQLDLRELMIEPPSWLSQWKGDGIITRSATPRLAQALMERQIPTVDLTDIYGQQGLPSVLNDHDRIGHLGAQHFLEKGFENFAFCGFSDHHWSLLREEGYQRHLSEAGFEPFRHASEWSEARAVGWGAQQSELVRWLSEIPKPVGVMACNDLRGQHVLEACRSLGIVVPEQVAVLGVDNDHVLCDFCSPPLSSVIPAAEQIGFEAARMLELLMNNKEVVNKNVRVQPLGIAERHSSEVMAIQDADVVTALQLIRDRACSGLTVAELLREIPVSRSALERKFRKYIGRSPQSQIRLSQMKRAKELLVNTDLSLHRIATIVGFKHAEYFNVVFKRVVGESPGRFRDVNAQK